MNASFSLWYTGMWKLWQCILEFTNMEYGFYFVWEMMSLVEVNKFLEAESTCKMYNWACCADVGGI
jgi:hypothetical protein